MNTDQMGTYAFWIENLLILLLGFIAISVILRLFNLLWQKTASHSLFPGPIVIAVRWIGILVIVALLLQRFDIHVMTLLSTVLAMVAIGVVAVWSLLSHIMATFLLMATKPFRVHDTVSITNEDMCGKVVDLNLFFTTLKAENGDIFQVPNNLFFQRVLRVTRNPHQQKDLSLGKEPPETTRGGAVAESQAADNTDRPQL